MACALALVLAVGSGLKAASSAGLSATGASCRRGHVEAVVRSFVRAFNAGDRTRLADLFVADPGFRWFSISDRVAADRGGRVFVA